MDFNEFKEQFTEDVKQELADAGIDAKVSINTVEKMNESYEAMTVTPEGSNVGVNVNMEKFFEAYENGTGLSKGADWVRGRVITDKAKVRYGGKLDFGKDYMSTGKAFRGVTSEKDIDTIAGNIAETKDYLNGLSKMI